MKKILVIGSGGREHAIADTLHRSNQELELYCAPGNAGMEAFAHIIPIQDTDVNNLLQFAKNEKIDLTVVGTEAALQAGIVDRFRAEDLTIFGHTTAATRIESSKEFAKQLMQEYLIPSADYRSFSSYAEAWKYVSARPFPAVIKYDGLAAGKGVVIAETPAQAEETLQKMLIDHIFGKGKVIIEEFLTGPEFSLMCFVNGHHVYSMPVAQDHKRAFDGDQGPNTGGMGAYTALPFITDEDVQYAIDHILQPTADAMCQKNCPLTGVLYAGLMKTPDGIKVIEFNARFGDPETEVVLPLLESDCYDIFEKIATGQEIENSIKWSKNVTLGVVLASKGYPEKYDKGFEIEGIGNITTTVYHMGTAYKNEKLITNGGRVLMIVAQSKTLQSAHQIAYSEIDKIKCDHLFYRHDIAHIALDHE